MKPSFKSKFALRLYLALFLFLITLVAYILFFYQSPSNFKKALSKALNVPEDYLTINIPPLDGRYPGAIIITYKNQCIPITYSYGSEGFKPVGSFSLNSTILTSGEIGLDNTINSLGSILNHSNEVNIKIKLTDGKVYELPVEKLKTIIREDSSVDRILAKGQKPEIIFRAYEAKLEISIQKKQKTTDTTWLQFKRNLEEDISDQKTNIKLESEDKVSYIISEPTVIAYEVLEASFVSNNLDVNSQETINLKHTHHTGIDAQNQPGYSLQGNRVLFVPIISQTYLGRRPATLPLASSSEELIEKCFSYFGVKALPKNDPFQILTVNRLKQQIVLAEGEISKKKYKSVVFYYIGHAYSRPDNSYYLIMGDYNNELSDSAILSLDDFYSIIAQKITVPFAILMDGCFSNSGFDELKKHLMLGNNLDYYGQAEVPINELNEYWNQIRKAGGLSGGMYSLFPNPIIFAAKPGELADFGTNPMGEIYPKVAPIAQKSFIMLGSHLGNFKDITLGEFLKSLCDYLPPGLGEISNYGTISWSNFNSLDTILLAKYEKTKKN